MIQPLAPSEKRTRDELITASDAYFDGMEKGTDKVTPFDPDCRRIENGLVTANDPGNVKQISRIPCGAQFAAGFTKVITKVQERRYPVVDEERGLRIEALVAPVPYGMPTGWGGKPSHKE